MPPLFTATNGLTLIRKVVHAARHVHPTVSRFTLSSRLTRVQRARIAFRNALYETYTSLASPITKPGHSHLGRQLQQAGRSPLVNASRSFRSSGFRLASLSPRGPALVANVGLAPARAFSTAPAPAVIANAPVYLRALLSVDDNLPKSNRYTPYRCKRARTNRHKRRTSSSSWFERVHKLEQYFPAPLRSPPAVDLPVLPEQLVTSGSTTTLSLALSPSLHDLLQPTTEITYREAELGMSIFADLLKGIPPVLEAFSIHGSTRIYPLLSKLYSLGVLAQEEIKASNARLELVTDHQGRPDVLNIIFPCRSVEDVKALLGETLSIRPGEGQWYGLYEAQALSPTETKEIVEDWGDARSAQVQLEDPESMSSWESQVEETDLLGAESCELVYPTLDFDAVHSPQVDTPPEVYSWPSTGFTSPSPSRPISPSSPDVEGLGLRTEDTWMESQPSLTESLVSRLDAATSPRWSVPLSLSDSDIESSIDLDDLGEVEHELWSVADVSERSAEDVESEVEWSGSTRGFGLIQPW